MFLGRDQHGRVRHKSKLFRGSHRDAELLLARMTLGAAADATAAVEATDDGSSGRTGPERWGDRTTVNDAVSGWKENGWADLSPTTRRRYEGIWERHVRERIGMERIVELSSYEVEKYFRQLKSEGSGRETLRYIRIILNRACRLARKWSGNRLPNPIADTELPRYPAGEQPLPVRALIS